MLKKKDALNEWEREFGEIEKVTDFSGRKMARSAYNNNHSKFGWTVACILPESKGGEYMTHNMVCCNIDTYREKGERFPAFVANGYSYIIKEVKNDYRILINHARNEGIHKSDKMLEADLRNGAEGVKYWHTCEDTDKHIFVAYAKIHIQTDDLGKLMMKRMRIFAEKIFELPAVMVKQESETQMEITFINFHLPTREDTKSFLSDCIIFNTYARFYLNEELNCKINIYCGMKDYISESNMSISDIIHEISDMEINYKETFAIDELIKINTRAGYKKQLGEPVNGFYKYNMCYKDLKNYLHMIINEM